MGLDRRTGQHALFDRDAHGMRHARSIMRFPEPQQWSLERIREVAITPWKAHEPETPVIVQADVPAGEARVRDDLPKTRRLYITQKDLDKYGYTTTCSACMDQVRAPDLTAKNAALTL